MDKLFIFLTLAVCVYGQQSTEKICTVDANTNGICVPYFLCRENGTIIEDGEGILDIRFGEECDASLEVCCGREAVTITPIIPSTVRPPPARLAGCGVRNVNGIGVRIANTKQENAQYGEFPWMVALLREVPVNGVQVKVYKCGGALIHWRAVVTAAHCITDNEQLTVRAGEWDTQITTETIPHQERRVIQSSRHDSFGRSNMFNDVAVLKLDTPFTPTLTINVICLPPEEQPINPTTCLVTGWGKDVFGKEGRHQAVLKKIELPIVSKNDCQRSLRRTRLGQKFMLHRSFACAGGVAGKDTCTGDGGSPLVCLMEGETVRYDLNGLVSWGIGCGENGVPGVYANMALYRQWIEDRLITLEIFDINEVNRI